MPFCFLLYLVAFRLWHSSIWWEWGLQQDGEPTWRGIAFFIAITSVFFTLAYWIANSPPANNFVSVFVGDAERWWSIGNAHLEVAHAIDERRV